MQTRFGTLIGNILYHYDTALFGWLTPFLAPILFPNKTGLEALLLTFSFLPLSYLAQPLGALFWGFLGDHFGRKPILPITLSGMALTTAAIGCVPLIPQAWIMVATCRLLQGFFSAGERTGTALFLIEHAPPSKRPFTSALFDATGIVGIFLASLLASTFGQVHWRPLFWLGAITGLIALFLRRHATESPEHKPTPISWKTLWLKRKPLLQITLVSGFSYANYFLLSVFLNGFLPQITTLKTAEVLLINTHLLWIDALLLLAFGWLCRYIQKEHLMAAATLLAALLAIPLFVYLEGASWGQAATIRLTLVTLGVALAAPYHAWKAEILPTDRFLIGGVGTALGAKLFGAPIPLLSTWLVTQTGEVWAAALPIVLLGFAATGTILWQLMGREQKSFTY